MYHEGSSVASDDATGVLQLRERGREVRHCSTQRGGGEGEAVLRPKSTEVR
jgi:hypothetical protein